VSVVERVAAFAALHEMFARGNRVGVAVSGGADSVFLLHLLRELAPSLDLRLSVVHIEHGIRGDASLADAEFVENLATGFELPFHLQRADVPALDDNLEQAARHMRTAFYRHLIESGAADRIATGHTRSDQAETVLYRLFRGSGLAGLSGILPVSEPGIIRPLLDVTRAEIETWLRDRSITWREDATNQDRSYARNRLRHEVLPLLAASFNPRIEDALANLATLARDEEAYWASELEAKFPATGEPVIVPVILIAREPTAVARRLARRLVQRAKGDLRGIELAHIERIVEMARCADGHDRVQLPGVDVFRSFEWLRFSKIASRIAATRDYAFQFQVPGAVELPGGLSRITLQMLEKPAKDQRPAGDNELDLERLPQASDSRASFELRNWRPGDRYRPVGRSAEEKIKLMFQEGRIPLWERRHWPIITYNGVILWTRQFGAAADFAAGPEARVVLRIDEFESQKHASIGSPGRLMF
jgi:tRNA(Ile)-lysidine synthase